MPQNVNRGDGALVVVRAADLRSEQNYHIIIGITVKVVIVELWLAINGDPTDHGCG